MHVDDVELREEWCCVCPSEVRLERFVSSMSWCLESALRRCVLRHSVMLTAELRRTIESKLSWPDIISLLIYQLGFEKSLIYQLLPFCFGDQSGGILVLLKKKKKNSGSLAHSLSSALQCYRMGHIHLRGKWRPRTPRWYNAALTHTK